LIAALLLSPIVWSHYVLVLLPPIAIASRRLSAVWLVPWGLWLAGGTWGTPSSAEIAVALAVIAAISGLVLLRTPIGDAGDATPSNALASPA
jgi:hypothetical protein